MASLRDVLNHAGKPVRITTGGGTGRDGLAVRRGHTVLVEAKLVPLPNDRIEFLDTKESMVVVSATAESALDKVDHYRVIVSPAARG